MSKLVSPEEMHEFLMSLPTEVLQDKSRKVKMHLRNLRKKKMLSSYFNLSNEFSDIVKQTAHNSLNEEINFNTVDNQIITEKIIISRSFESTDKVKQSPYYYNEGKETAEAA